MFEHYLYHIDGDRKITAHRLGSATDYSQIPRQVEEHRCVGETYLSAHWVSTKFLSTNLSFHESGPPILFETMSFPWTPDGGIDFHKEIDFGDGYDSYTFGRYATWAEAIEGHCLAVVEVQLFERNLIAMAERKEKALQLLQSRDPGAIHTTRKVRL